jgi:hypothetical protein
MRLDYGRRHGNAARIDMMVMDVDIHVIHAKSAALGVVPSRERRAVWVR